MAGSRGHDEAYRELDLLLRGFQVSRLLRAVADLGIADRIGADGATAIADLAAACRVQPVPLLRILRALAAFGVFRVSADGQVSHSARSRPLRADAPGSLQHAARFWTAPGSWRAWDRLDVALSGGNPHHAAWGVGRFDYLRQHPDESRLFDVFMAHFPDDRHAAVAASYDFSAARLIVDVGGGNGETLRHILARFPAPRGLVFDRPDVAASIPGDGLVPGRMTAEGGSFFDRVPAGGDHYLLVRVLHNWGDEDCLRILRSCRAAMHADARLLIGEHVLEPDPERGEPTEYLIDVQMMAMFGEARERTESELRDLLATASLVLRRVIATPSAVSILEAVPA